MMNDIIKTILVVLILRQEVSSDLMLSGFPDTATHGAVYLLRCSRNTFLKSWLKKAQFYKNGISVATVERKAFYRPYSCLHDGDEKYDCESTPTTKTLIINNINSTRDNNTVWSCSGAGTNSNTYAIVVKTVPVSCKPTTAIMPIMKNTVNDDDDDGFAAATADDDHEDDGFAAATVDDEDMSNKLVLNEGDDLHLNCSTKSSDQSTNISYKWEMYGDNSQSRLINNQSIYFKPNVTRRDAGMYVCTGSSGPDCDSNGVVRVRVHYPLSLNITVNYTLQDVELICRVVVGYPTNFTMNNWRHYIDGQFVREIEGVTTEDRTALVLNNTKINEGTYVCNASNGIKDFKGSVYQTDETYINIEAPPMVLTVSNASETHVGSIVEINTAFIIGGDALNITWYQQQQNSSTITEISVDTQSEHGIRPLNIYGTVINKHVTIISGSVTISKMVDLTVTVTVCTQYGCTDSYQHVTVLPEITTPTGSTVPRKVSENNDNLISSNDELPVNVPVIAGGVVGAVVVIGLIVLIIVLTRRRSNNNTKSVGTVRQNQPNSSQYKNPMYDSSQVQPTNDQCLYGNDNLLKNQQQIRDNQTMEIMENDLYISADDDDKNADGAETKPEMEILENDLYIPAEIDNRTFQVLD